MKKDRLTVGCRARILSLKEKPKQTNPGYYSDEDYWRKNYGDREVLLVERTSYEEFSVMLLGKGVKTLEKEKYGIITDQMACVPEEVMVLVDKDFNTNLDFMDWYKEHKDDFCPDCLTWFPDNKKEGAICPNNMRSCFKEMVTNGEKK